MSAKSQDASKRYYGKYRGSVERINDPEGRGRLILKVPDVLGKNDSTWAEPCVPLAGPTGFPMGVFFVPPVGTAVWVEFEAGENDHPIWVGCLWAGKGNTGVPEEARAESLASPPIVLQTMGRNAIVISDVPGSGITLQAASGASISVNDAGITITTADGASVELGAGQVNINRGALEIQ